jgi:hypothetical protein
LWWWVDVAICSPSQSLGRIRGCWGRPRASEGMHGREGGYSRRTGYRTTRSRRDSRAGDGDDVARRGGLVAADGGAGVVTLGDADAVGVVAVGEGALVALPTTPPSPRCPRPAVRAGARPLGRGCDVAPRSGILNRRGRRCGCRQRPGGLGDGWWWGVVMARGFLGD